MGGMKDYQWKEESQPREGRKISKGRKGNDDGRMKDYKAKGRKVIKHGKEGSQPQEGRRMTMEWMKDYQGKEGSQLREGRNITKGREEDDHGKEGRIPREGRKFIKGRKDDYQGKVGRLSSEGRKSKLFKLFKLWPSGYRIY